jgi:hypothetical protein
MAFVGEAPVLTWQRVDTALAAASPNAQMLFRSFKSWLMQHKQGPQLQFVPFDRTTNGSNGGNATAVIVAGAARLYAIYGKKYTGTTLSYLGASNHATAMQAEHIVNLSGAEAGTEVSCLWSGGLPFATGIVISGVTAYNGTTQSLIVDSWDGFAIISA